MTMDTSNEHQNSGAVQVYEMHLHQLAESIAHSILSQVLAKWQLAGSGHVIAHDALRTAAMKGIDAMRQTHKHELDGHKAHTRVLEQRIDDLTHQRDAAIELLKECYLAMYGGNSRSVKEAMERMPQHADPFERKIARLIKTQLV